MFLGTSAGFYLWIASGANPDNSGGTGIIVYGAVVVGMVVLLVRIRTKRRSILYGTGMFLWFTVYYLLIRLIS
jgi:hypothetical protein